MGSGMETLRREEMKRKVIAFLCLFILSGVAGLQSITLAAGTYPSKPIAFIMPLGPSGDLQMVMQPWLQKTSAALGQPIVIVNKPGAGGAIAYRELHAAKPDGYTLGGMIWSLLSLKLQGMLPYDYRDFTIINTQANQYGLIIASKKGKRIFKTMEEVISSARSNPLEVTIATTAVGQTWWIAALYLQDKLGIKLTIVPQEEGGGMVATQVAGGHIDLGIMGLASARSQIEAGNVEILACLSPDRFAEPYHYVRTMREIGYDVTLKGWSGIIGPPKMPPEIVDKLANTFIANLGPDIMQHFAATAQHVNVLRSAEAIKAFDEERNIIKAMMDKAGILKEK
jgi:tripartite-type tricarboxylate transporter receptor subunit TctC